MEVTDPKACTLFLLSKLADKKVRPQGCRSKMQLMKNGQKNSIYAGADDPWVLRYVFVTKVPRYALSKTCMGIDCSLITTSHEKASFSAPSITLCTWYHWFQLPFPACHSHFHLYPYFFILSAQGASNLSRDYQDWYDDVQRSALPREGGYSSYGSCTQRN